MTRNPPRTDPVGAGEPAELRAAVLEELAIHFDACWQDPTKRLAPQPGACAYSTGQAAIEVRAYAAQHPQETL